MKKLILTYLIFLISFAAQSQVYKVAKPVSPTFTNYAGHLTIEKSVDGILFFNQTNTIYQYKNGLLSTLPPIPIDHGFDSSFISDIEIFDNKIFVSGVFDDFGSGNINYGLIYLDAGKWEPVPSTTNLKIRKIVNAGNFLYCLTATYGFRGAVWDFGYFINNTGLIKMNKSLGISNVLTAKIDNLTTFNTNEIVFTKFPLQRIFKYDSSAFDSLTIPFTPDSSVFSTANSGDTSVYFRSKKYIFSIEKSFTLNFLDSSSKMIYYFPAVKGVYDGALYFDDRGMLQRKIFDLKTKTFKNFYGLNDSAGNNFWESGNDMMNYGKFYTVTHPEGSKTLASEVEDGTLLTGCVFEDLNNNCVKDKGEKIIRKMRVELSQGSKSFLNYTNDTGYYQMVVPGGTYNVNVKNKHIKNNYDSCGGKHVFDSAKKYVADIPFRINSGIKDISGFITGGTGFVARRGATENYFISYDNVGSTTENITLTLEYPDSLTLISSSLSPTSHTGRVLTYNVSNVPKFGSGKIKLEFEIHAKKQLNSIIKFVCNTLTKTNDQDSSDNTDTLNQRIVAAIDPNIKQSYPEGAITKPVNKILYQIRFQNEGNYFARKVTVVDTFDAQLPLSKIQMKGSKHPYTLRIEKGNIMIWEFNNINLPPKSDGDEESQGFISFEAVLNKPLAVNDKILNRAHIYFDYEDPLPTPYTSISMVQNTNSIITNASVLKNIKIHPNPAFDKFTIEGTKSLGTINIFNNKGEMIQQTNTSLQTIDILTDTWKSGLYIIVIPQTGVNFKLLKL